MATRYLKQIGSNHIYSWTDILRKKKDMVEIDAPTARAILANQQVRKPAMQGIAEVKVIESTDAGIPIPNEPSAEERIKELEKKLSDAYRLLGMSEEQIEKANQGEGAVQVDDYEKGEGEPEEEKVEPEPETSGAEEDPDILMLEGIRKKGRGKQQIEKYMFDTYGIDVDRRFNLDELVDQAVEKRKEELAKS